MDKIKEQRKCELRSSGDEGNTVEGYALLFDTESDGLGFIESIAPGALDGVIERSDVFAVINHDPRRGVLARSRNGHGSLQLEVDGKGLRYRFVLPDTELGRELRSHIERGEICESSFAFIVDEDEWSERATDGKKTMVRRIKKIGELFDVSPVYNAAYSATSVDLRGRDALLQSREEARLALDGWEKRLDI